LEFVIVHWMDWDIMMETAGMYVLKSFIFA